MAGIERRLLLPGVLALVFLLMRLLPAQEGLSDAGWAVAALAVVMAMSWLTEAMPLPVTSMLPFLLLPLMGAVDASDVAALYWSPVIFLVLGGAIIAVAVERHGLHLRLAMAVVRHAPGSQRGLLFGFMAATALISMLVSNTASALIMMPVALALASATGAGNKATAALVLGVAWAANIGGAGTLVGTPTNAISAGIIERSLGLKIDFLTWLAFGLPLVLLAVPLAALVLILMFRVERFGHDRAGVLAVLGEPGPLDADQKRVVAVLLLLMFGWVFWPLLAAATGTSAPDDGLVAIGVAMLLILLPGATGGTLLDWTEARARVPWDILLLFGGGLALAGAITQSGLAAWIGAQMSGLSGLHPMLLALIVVAVVVLVTEFASNVAAASAFMPVVAAVAEAQGVSALPLVMASAFAASWGYMMPAGTPPNAIAFATGKVELSQMVRSGAIVNLIGVLLMVGVAYGVAALL